MLTYGVREALRLELGSERVNVVHDSWLGLLVRRCLLVWRFSLRHDLGTRFADVCGSAQGAQNKGAKECGRVRVVNWLLAQKSAQKPLQHDCQRRVRVVERLLPQIPRGTNGHSRGNAGPAHLLF